MKKIIVTGGHLTPALAVMDELKRRQWDILYVGRKHALEGDDAVSQEFRTVQKLGYRFEYLTAVRFQRHFSIGGFWSLLKIPVGILRAFNLIGTFKPNRVLSFGGYVAFPVALAAWLRGIPVITHEQTLSPGLANRLIATVARDICIGWKDLQTDFPKEKTHFTGNPIRQDVLESRKTLPVITDKPLLYITGGNLGSHAINNIVFQSIAELTKTYSVVHQTGNAAEFGDFEKAKRLKETLPSQQRARYYPVEYVDQDRVGWVMNKAGVVVGRSGANTVTELIALKKPSVLIPLPWSGAGEQYVNAKRLADSGGATLLPQNELTPVTLTAAIDALFAKRGDAEKQLVTLSPLIVPNAPQKIVEVIES